MYCWKVQLTAYRMPLAEGDCMPRHCQILDMHRPQERAQLPELQACKRSKLSSGS